jgi:carboxyl-terminal processing protease
MEENKTIIKLERHEWPDEKEKRLEDEENIKKEKKAKKIRRRLNSLLLILGIVIGMLIYKNVISKQPIVVKDDNEKIAELKSVMENQWFFSDQIEDLDTVIIDNALYGMTNFEDVDKHTKYLSAEEIEAFQTSINMGYVGIGVQYTTTGELNIVTRVFSNSPAEKAGVLAGDIIDSVDGEKIVDKTSEEIRTLVLGEKDSIVIVGFIRGIEEIYLSITRDEVVNTAFGKMIDDNTGYLEIYSFGTSTYDESKAYLTQMSEAGMEDLVIDLRDNGGGYLTSLISMSGLFLDDGTVAMQQVYANGDVDKIYSKGTTFNNINNIVILINEYSASASEVLTMALKEQRDDVIVMGDTSYGKGTVQTTVSFSDGSAVKYTTSKWLSPNGVWINGVGITPDIEVSLDDILNETILVLDDETFTYDDVSLYIKIMQQSLEYMEYDIDRVDGYFSNDSQIILKEYQSDYDLEKTGILDKETYNSLIGNVKRLWSMDKNYDKQLQKALGELNG